MELRTMRRILLFLILVAVLVAPRYTYSCGPYFEEPIFRYTDSPNVPLARFYAGELGILLPTYKRSYMVIAYRYLMNLGPSRQAQKSVLEPAVEPSAIEFWDESAVLKMWKQARERVANAPPLPQKITQGAPLAADQPYEQFLNCPNNAFVAAAHTLDERIGKYGPASKEVHEWLTNQDKVFSNCGTTPESPVVMPAALTIPNPLLARDRAYQTAAANFYGRDFDRAAQLFDAIANDHFSPWSERAPYLAARAMIRKATLRHGKDESFDKTAMAEAENRLETILSNPAESKIHDMARQMLNFVRFRTHPGERAAELEAEMVSKNFELSSQQDFEDYLRLCAQGQQAGDLSDWLNSFEAHIIYDRGEYKEDAHYQEAVSHVLQQWKENGTLPWLIAALKFAPPSDPAVPKLLTAAEKVPARSPAYLTVRYYALGLKIASGQEADASKELDNILGQTLPNGVRNLFVEERLPVATSFDDFLRYAAEAPAAMSTDENRGKDVPTVQPRTGPPQAFLDTYAAKIFAKRLPLDLYSQATMSPVVPRSLRRDLALAGWARAILLNDLSTAARMTPLLIKLEPTLRADLQSFQAASSDAEKKFAAIFLILKHPGLKPHPVRGKGRQEIGGGSESLAIIDDLRDNWWCASMGANPWENNYGEYELAEYSQKPAESNFKDPDANFPYPDFLTAEQRSEAARQWDELTKLGTAPNYLSQQVVEWAKAHPEDQRAPEALYLAVRSTRYGCTNKLTTKYSKSAFDLLHQKYPQSEWAKKTKYYF